MFCCTKALRSEWRRQNVTLNSKNTTMAKVYQANEIKNIAMLGGSGSGKTTLMESMLFESGVIKRRGSIETQSTVCDYFPVEMEYGY